MSLIHWVVWGTGRPKDRDEVNRREVCEREREERREEREEKERERRKERICR